MKRPLTAQEQTLRIQSRRRMIGAFVLMFAVVLFLPMMLNHATGPKLPVPPPAASDKPASAQPPVPEVAPAQPSAAAVAAAPVATASAAAADAVAQAAAVSPAPAAAAVPAPAAETPVTPASSAASPRQAGKPGSGRYLVQVGVFGDRHKAQALARRLEQEKLPVISEDVRYKEGVRVRVRLGPFEGRGEAVNVVHHLDQLGIKSMMVAP
ncbi:MAG: SPOR domain-containing protein [Betaproteobacteria bacterium]|nr:SPOR domain-containing protein [Betaproteobacteria bacterium]